MIIPIRCFSCGKSVAQDWEEYDRRVKAGENPEKVLESFGYERYCCRRMFVSHVETIDDIISHKRF